MKIQSVFDIYSGYKSHFSIRKGEVISHFPCPVFRFPCSSIIRCFPVFGILSGIYSISSSTEQSSTSHIRSMCSTFKLTAISWYHSLIALRLIPVNSDNLFCVIRRSPRSFDKCILIINNAPWENNITIRFFRVFFNHLYRFTVFLYHILVSIIFDYQFLVLRLPFFHY